MTPKITRSDIDRSSFKYSAHYNMGFVEGRHKGYGYGYRCIEFPRLGYIDRVYTLDDGGETRTWSVDGADVPDLDAAILALNLPPVLTEDEQRILTQVPEEFTDLRKVEDKLAGVPRPEGAIMPDTPHARVLKWLEALQNKGMIEYGVIYLPPVYYDFSGEMVTPRTVTVRRRRDRAAFADCDG